MVRVCVKGGVGARPVLNCRTYTEWSGQLEWLEWMYTLVNVGAEWGRHELGINVAGCLDGFEYV